jgi:trk system potassium uptake protein
MKGKAEINIPQVIHLISIFLVFEGLFMLPGMLFAFYFNEDQPLILLYSFFITSGTGVIAWYFTHKNRSDSINKREGFIVVALTWIIISLFGSLPFMISGFIPSFTDAFFETMSGFTTTGASILGDVEALPKSLLFWRSMTQWTGGMGIIVLSVAVLPFLGVGAMQLYSTEMPGITKDQLHPRITEMGKKLLAIYIILTVVHVIMLLLGKMPLFDSLCHAFGSMGTGGFSTKNTGISGYSSYIQYVITFFMLIAGMNFTLHYFAFTGKFKLVWHNEEFRKYLYIIFGFTLLIAALLVWQSGAPRDKAFRDALFQVVSIVSTTGYATSDYVLWPTSIWFFIFLLMFAGGMAGSTAGGIKIIRHILLFKNAGKEMKRALHPQAIIPVRLDREAVSQDVIFKVMAFFQLYILILVAGTLCLSFLGIDFLTATGASLSALGNIGPGLGKVGPTGNYAYFPEPAKWVLSALMMLGRLELFSFLILFSRSFWRR